jgi:hypothetical protein
MASTYVNSIFGDTPFSLRVGSLAFNIGGAAVANVSLTRAGDA